MAAARPPKPIPTIATRSFIGPREPFSELHDRRDHARPRFRQRRTQALERGFQMLPRESASQRNDPMAIEPALQRRRFRQRAYRRDESQIGPRLVLSGDDRP